MNTSGSLSSKSGRLLSEMAVRPAVRVSLRDSLAHAAVRMRAANAEASAVVECGCLVGIIDENHPDTHAVRYGHDPLTTRVEEVMTKGRIYCFEDQPCEDALRVMEEHHLRYMAVVDRCMAPVGLVSRSEIHRVLSGG
jgi:predicted transcriptional regulator